MDQIRRERRKKRHPEWTEDVSEYGGPVKSNRKRREDEQWESHGDEKDGEDLSQPSGANPPSDQECPEEHDGDASVEHAESGIIGLEETLGSGEVPLIPGLSFSEQRENRREHDCGDDRDAETTDDESRRGVDVWRQPFRRQISIDVVDRRKHHDEKRNVHRTDELAHPRRGVKPSRLSVFVRAGDGVTDPGEHQDDDEQDEEDEQDDERLRPAWQRGGSLAWATSVIEELPHHVVTRHGASSLPLSRGFVRSAADVPLLEVADPGAALRATRHPSRSSSRIESFKCVGSHSPIMFPEDTTSAEGEATYGRRLTIFIVVWLAITIALAILMILLAPWLTGVF